MVVLTQASLDATERQPSLGVRLGRDGAGFVAEWVQPAGIAWDAGLRPGDRIVAVDGQPVSSTSDLARATTVRALAPDGQERSATTETAALVSADRRARWLLTGGSWAALGCLVFLLAADRLSAAVFLAWGLSGAATAITAIATPFGSAWALGLEYLSVLAAGATLFLLSLVFPVNRLRGRAGRWLAIGCLAATVILSLAYLAIVDSAPATYAGLQRAAFTLVGLELAGGVAGLVLAFARSSPARSEARRAVGIITLGITVAVLPFVLLTLVPSILGRGYVLSPDGSSMFVVIGQASVAAAVVTREILGINRMVSRGLIAALVWMMLLGAYTLGFDVLRQAQLTIEPTGVRFGSILIAVALVAGTFPIAQQHLRRRIERVLFRDVYSYSDILRELGAEIVRLSGAEAISRHVLRRLGSTIDVVWVAIALDEGPAGSGFYCWGECPPDPLDGAAAEHVPLLAEGATIGQLVIGPKRRDSELSADDRTLLITLAPLVATALQSALLVRRLESQVAALGEREHALGALNLRLMQVQEEERQRIALDLHDDPLQRAILLARHVNGDLMQGGPTRLRQITEEIIVSLRAICTGLHPPVLDDFGLVAGLERLVNDVCARSDLAASLSVRPDVSAFGRLDSNLEMALYRVAQEALNNCLKHAEASRVTVSVEREGGRVTLRVVDDGRGVNGAATTGAVVDAQHLGILGMRERLRPWHGELTVEPGVEAGTMVSAYVEA
jgi:signal transduction histidine kinase